MQLGACHFDYCLVIILFERGRHYFSVFSTLFFPPTYNCFFLSFIFFVFNKFLLPFIYFLKKFFFASSCSSSSIFAYLFLIFLLFLLCFFFEKSHPSVDKKRKERKLDVVGGRQYVSFDMSPSPNECKRQIKN